MLISILKSVKTLLIVLLLIILLFVYFGYSYYQHSLSNALITTENNIQSIAKHKSSAITNWYKERFADSHFLFRNEILRRLLSSYNRSKSLSDSLEIVSAISTIYTGHDYFNMFIINSRGEVVVNLNPVQNSSLITDSLNSALQRNEIVFSNLYVDPFLNSPTMDIYVPFLFNDTHIASLIFKVDPNQILFPLLLSSFIDNSSIESYLISVENDSIVFLSPLKYLPSLNQLYKRSVNDSSLALTKIINSSDGFIKGSDYRGIQALSAIRTVEHTPWHIVTDIDLEEVYAPVNEDTFKNILILLALVIIGGLALIIYYTKTNYYNLQKIYDAEQKLKDILDYSTNLFYSHTTDHVLTYVSPQSKSILGYSSKELKIRWPELATDNPVNAKGLELTNLAITSGKPQQPYELELRKKNGELIWVEVREAPVVKSGKTIAIVGSLTDITQRKKAEKDLQESEEIFNHFMENSPVFVFFKDENIRSLRLSKNYEQLLGKPLDELIGKSMDELFPSDLAKSMIEDDQRILRENKTIVVDEEFSGRFYTTIKFPITIDGYPRYLAGYTIDNTDRKLYEEKIKILEKAVEQSPVSVIITDLDGRIQYVNKKFTMVTGYSFNEVHNKNPNILKSGLQPESFYKNLWDTILSGNVWQGELQNKKKNGALFWEQAIISPISNSDGSISHFVAVKEDITDRKLKDELIRENQEKFRLIFDNSNEALFLTKPDGSIVAANPAACRMFQYSEHELIQYGKNAIIDVSDPRLDSLLKERSSTGRALGEVTFIRKNGEKFIGELSSSVFKDKDGNLKTSTIVRDITERKKFEQDLIDSKEKAEEISRLKSNFLANMSHELRTPLVGILGYAELLLEELQNVEHLKMSHTILHSGRNLLDTLNSILDISRIEANKQFINIKPVNLIDLLRDSLYLYKPIADDKSLELNLLLPDEPVLIDSDNELLLKIFSNLINNAVKYTNKGHITVKLSQLYSGLSGIVVIDVIDTGIGISKSHQSIVFEPFRQVSEGFSRNYDGAGLGLSITKKFVELLKGEISLVSEPGRGSTFSVKLPVKLQIQSPDVKIEEIADAIELVSLPVLPSDTKVLLVEDDLANAGIIISYLKDSASVDHVFDGYTALNKCKHKKYDVILMDINLKGINGVETFRQIRSLDDYNSQVPVIAITAYAMKGDRHKFLSYGFNDYISKPFERSLLITVLSQVLGVKK